MPTRTSKPAESDDIEMRLSLLNFKLEDMRGLEKAEHLSETEAHALVQLGRTLELDNLKTLSLEVAGQLMRCSHSLRMPALKEIDEHVGCCLGNCAGYLFLTGLRTITVGVARQLKKTQWWLDLGGLTSISSPVASQLAEHPGWLSLRGIRELKPNIAKALSRHVGMGLSLGGIAELSEECAGHLAQHRGGILRLAKLTRPSPSIRTILAEHRGTALFQAASPCRIRLSTFQTTLHGNPKPTLTPMIQSPENIVLTCDVRGIPFSRPLELTNDDPEAITICVLNTPAAPVVITTTAGAHMFIYTALKICATTAKAPQRKAILKKFGCKVVHGTLDEGVLQRFNTLLEQGRGFPRYSVISARLWLDPAESVDAPFSVLAFWNGKAFADQAVVSLLVKTFQLKTPFFLAHAQDEMAEWR